MNGISYEKVYGLLRHLLTTSSGVLVADGVASSSTPETVLGGLVALLGVVWSWSSKKDS